MKPASVNRITERTSRCLLMILGLALTASAQAIRQAPQHQARPKRHVVVSIPDRKLAVIEHDGTIVRIFPVGVGAKVSPSPTGVFQIVSRIAKPTYYHPGSVIPPGRDNPLGSRWLGLDKKGYGIHGTNVPISIGKAASHGCIRMRNRDIEQFYRLVEVGDTVEIRGSRDAQIAAIFGGAEESTSVAQSTFAPAAGGQ